MRVRDADVRFWGWSGLPLGRGEFLQMTHLRHHPSGPPAIYKVLGCHRRVSNFLRLDESPAEQSAHHAAHYAVHRAADRADWTANTTRIASTAPSATTVLMVRFAGLRRGVH